MLKSSGELLWSILNLQLFDLLMGEPSNPHFYDFWIFGRIPEPQNQYYLSLETPRYLKKSQEMSSSCWKYHVCKYRNNGYPKFWKCWKSRAPENPDDPSNNIWKSQIWDQYVSKSAKWQFDNMKSLNLWNFITKTQRNLETKKPRNFETKKL